MRPEIPSKPRFAPLQLGVKRGSSFCLEVLHVNAVELARRSRGLKTKEVAEAIGVSVSVLSHVERGGRRPYPKLRRELARVLGTRSVAL